MHDFANDFTRFGKIFHTIWQDFSQDLANFEGSIGYTTAEALIR